MANCCETSQNQDERTEENFLDTNFQPLTRSLQKVRQFSRGRQPPGNQLAQQRYSISLNSKNNGTIKFAAPVKEKKSEVI